MMHLNLFSTNSANSDQNSNWFAPQSKEKSRGNTKTTS